MGGRSLVFLMLGLVSIGGCWFVRAAPPARAALEPRLRRRPQSALSPPPPAPRSQGRFLPPPEKPPPGTWPPPGWAPGAQLQDRDRRRAARRKKGLPEADPRDDLEQARLTDLRPAPGAPWGEAGGRPLPPQWRDLPGRSGGGGGGGAPLGDVENDVSVAYRYGDD
jgi:hypothetical protein